MEFFGTPDMKLCYSPLSPYCRKVRMAMEFKALTFELVEVDNVAHMPVWSERAEVPVLIDADEVISDSSDILVYLDRKFPERKVYPENPSLHALVCEWERFASGRFDPAVAVLGMASYSKAPAPPNYAMDAARVEIREAFRRLDSCLKEREFLANAISAADFSVYPLVANAIAMGIKLDADDYPMASRWLSAIKSLPFARSDAQAVRGWWQHREKKDVNAHQVNWGAFRLEWLLAHGLHHWFAEQVDAGRVLWSVGPNNNALNSQHAPVQSRTVKPDPSPAMPPHAGLRKHMTLMFTDVSGSSEYAESLVAEDYAALLSEFRAIARSAIAKHGGTVARMQGDGLLAAFGHDVAREDDGRRAVEAAFELHQLAANLQVGKGPLSSSLKLHSGIHAGLVLVLEGDIERGRFDVVGEPPNTAARLCSMAAAGEILVSVETLGPQAHFFDVLAVNRLQVRGRSNPIDVVKVLGKSEEVLRRINAASIRGSAPIAGRIGVLQKLCNAFSEGERGKLKHQAVVGEPGMGKSRLLNAFQEYVLSHDGECWAGYCENYLGAEVLQPFNQIVRSFDRANATTMSRGVADRFKDLIDGRDKARPLALILDDWQWADDASRVMLDSVLADQRDVFVVVASRPTTEEIVVSNREVMHRIESLGDDDVRAIISFLRPAANEYEIGEVTRLAGGNPLYVEELCHALKAGVAVDGAQSQAGVAWLNALIASRLENLEEEEANGIRLASVLGSEFDAEQLLDMASRLGMKIPLPDFGYHDFLQPTGTGRQFKFRHGLTRDAIYATLGLTERTAIHHIVVTMLEIRLGSNAPDVLPALAYHCDAAQQHPRAIGFAELAGDAALQAMALDRARAMYLLSLNCLDLGTVDFQSKHHWCKLAEKLGQTHVFDPLDTALGYEILTRAARYAGELAEPNAIARAEYWLAYVNYGKGRPKPAVRHAENALRYAQKTDDQRLVAQVQATLGQALASAGKYGDALPLLDAAVQSKKVNSRPGGGAAIGSAYSLGRKAYTLGDLGRYDEAHFCFAESLALLGPKLHSVGASVRELMCVVYLWQGRWDEAFKIGSEGAEMAYKCRSKYLHAMGKALAACASWAKAKDMASYQVLKESTQWIEDRGGAVSTSLNYGWLVEAAIHLGLDDDVRRHAARLFVRFRMQDTHGVAQGCRALAQRALEAGDVAHAVKYRELAERAADWRQSPREKACNGAIFGKWQPNIA